MAEYSRMAQGSFACTAGQQVVYLPFVPDYVLVQNIQGNNHNAAVNTVNTLQWTSNMNQGDGILTVQDASGNIHYNNVTNYANGFGIQTFSAGLSFSFGTTFTVSSITKASPAVVTTTAAHGYSIGDIVIFEGISGMQQIAGIPLQITAVPSTTTFQIASSIWNVNQSNYSAVSTGTVKKINYPFLYAPGISFISGITLGTTTVINTTTPHNLVVGQQVAFRIPLLPSGSQGWGTIQLNSLPNTQGIPGSPMYGYVTTVNSSTQVTVNINSSSFTAFNSNIAATAVAGLSFPQMVAVGDVNTGGWPISLTTSLYPSPVVNGVSTMNGPSIYGAFVNNTRKGFVIGPAILTGGTIGTSTFFWQAMAFDYLNYQSVGVTVT